jgi:hypothetical protein
MARKRRERQKVTRRKAASDARPKSRIGVSSVHRTSTTINVLDAHQARLASPQQHPPDLGRDVHGRTLGALADMRNNGLSFSKAARKWNIHRDTFRSHAKSGLRQLKSGRIVATDKDRIRNAFSKPTTQPGEYHEIVTRNREERRLYAQWRVALDAAAHGDWTLIDAYPKAVSIDGVRLPTSQLEIQKIIEALEKEGSKFEGPYRVSTGATA